MIILAAPNAMKNSISATKFCDAIRSGSQKYDVEVISLPVADGGDGTAEIIAQHLQARPISCQATDPIGNKISATYYLKDKVAVIDMATASGLKLLAPEQYNALVATSTGTGELISDAINHGANEIILGVGGSATVDAGIGALMSLGFKFYTNDEWLETGGGKNIGNIIYIDDLNVSEKVKKCKFTLLCDVRNPLLGDNGAVKSFAPQKGADAKEISILEKNMSLFTGTLFQKTGKNCSSLEFGGAAGGIAASFYALLDAKLVSGADYILDLLNFDELVKQCEVVITGEGKIDRQSNWNKAPIVVLNRAKMTNKKVFAICGSLEPTINSQFDAIYSLTDEKTSEIEAIDNAFQLISKKTSEIILKQTNKDL